MQRNHVKKISVIGAGPVGLAFIIGLIKEAKDNPRQQYHIDVIEKRDLHFKRGQKLIIQSDQTPVRGTRWDDFCLRVFFKNQSLTFDRKNNLLVDGKIPSRTSHRYQLMQKIYRQSRSKFHINFSIKQLQHALLEHIENTLLLNVTIHWHLHSIIQSIDLVSKQLLLSNQDQIEFQYLVNCEGDGRETVPKINEALENSYEGGKTFKYETIGDKETYHMAIKIRVKTHTSDSYQHFLRDERNRYNQDSSLQQQVKETVDKKFYIGNEQFKIKDLPFIYDPNMYKEELHIDWVPKFFVAGIVPKMIHDIQDKTLKRTTLLHVASHVTAYKFQLPPDIFEIDPGKNKDNSNLRALTFTVLHKFVTNPVITLPNGIVIALVGDASMTPHYYAGFSSTIGLNEALTLATCIQRNEDKNTYQPFKNVYVNYVRFISYCIKQWSYFYTPHHVANDMKIAIHSEEKKPRPIEVIQTIDSVNEEEQDAATAYLPVLDLTIISELETLRNINAKPNLNYFLQNLKDSIVSSDLRIYVTNYIKENTERVRKDRLRLFSFNNTTQGKLISQLLRNIDRHELRELRDHAYYLENLPGILNANAHQKAKKLHGILDNLLDEPDLSVITSTLAQHLTNPDLTQHRRFIHPPCTTTIRLLHSAINELNTFYAIPNTTHSSYKTIQL